MTSLFPGSPLRLVFKWHFDHLGGQRLPIAAAPMQDEAMTLLSELSEHRDPQELGDRLRGAHVVTAGLMSEIIGSACRRFPSMGQGGKTARIERLISSEAWTDAALALIDLELPLWQVRRIAYDEGEWYCALSRERELPDWLDRAIR